MELQRVVIIRCHIMNGHMKRVLHISVRSKGTVVIKLNRDDGVSRITEHRLFDHIEVDAFDPDLSHRMC